MLQLKVTFAEKRLNWPKGSVLKTTYNVKNGHAGYHWFKSFMERHPYLSIQKSQDILMNGLVSVNKEQVSEYFEKLKSILIENDLFNQRKKKTLIWTSVVCS